MLIVELTAESMKGLKQYHKGAGKTESLLKVSLIIKAV